MSSSKREYRVSSQGEATLFYVPVFLTVSYADMFIYTYTLAHVMIQSDLFPRTVVGINKTNIFRHTRDFLVRLHVSFRSFQLES